MGSEHLYALLEDLLLISRADSDQLRLNREIVSLLPIVADAVEELELTAVDHGITIQMAIPERFPRLYADAVRLRQVVRNLVSNALRFTPSEGQVIISAHVETATQEIGSDDFYRQYICKYKILALVLLLNFMSGSSSDTSRCLMNMRDAQVDKV